MANMKDVAQEAGVSVTTVSHVINETRYVSPELTERVNEAIEELNYHPDHVAKGLKEGKTSTIGLVISAISNPFYPNVVKGVEDCAREHGYSMMLFNTDEEPAEEKKVISLLKSKRMSGFIISPTTENPSEITSMIGEEKNFVIIDRNYPDIDVDQVYSDNEQGAYDAVEHLIEYGHEKIGLVLGPTNIPSIKERLEGYKAALRDNNLEVGEDYIVKSGLEVEGAYICTGKLLKNNPELTAIFSTNNVATQGVFHYFKDKNIQCPQNIALIGFDDPPWAKLVQPTISSVAQKPYTMGYRAAEVLFERIEEDQKKYKFVELSTKLVMRESTTGIDKNLVTVKHSEKEV